MARQASDTAKYLYTLLLYFEEEVMGEAYFHGLKAYFSKAHQRKKLDLLAEVERCAAEAVRPLLQKHGLVPRSDADLKLVGEQSCEEHGRLDWHGLMTYMSVRYPGYLDDFAALENMAPDEDLQALQLLTEHEVVAIEFANRELSGTPDSMEPLLRYVGRPVVSAAS